MFENVHQYSRESSPATLADERARAPSPRSISATAPLSAWSAPLLSLKKVGAAVGAAEPSIVAFLLERSTPAASKLDSVAPSALSVPAARPVDTDPPATLATKPSARPRTTPPAGAAASGRAVADEFSAAADEHGTLWCVQ